MKEALVSKGPKVQIIDSPLPKPGADQVVIRVIVSGSNPKDWKVPMWMNSTLNQGDDIAGVVHEVGENVTEFKTGDRVAAFHEMLTPGGSYAEYALAHQHTTFHIPKHTTFEEAAAIPLAAMTSAVGLYIRLGLPQPWGPPVTESIPLIIYGAGTAVGSYAIQLAQRSNIHPLICVAGRSVAHVEKLIDRSKGDTLVDYRGGDDALVENLQKAVNGKPVLYAFDAVSENNSYVNLGKVLAEGAKITLVLPKQDDSELPSYIQHSITSVGSVHKDNKDFGYIYFRYFTRGLQEGWFKPQPQEVRPGGLGGVQQALEDLMNGKASAVKYVFRISETEGVS
ncbi:GroES-like protein [Xylariaceae sp. AK1471]|nr:GroES-like protein [Xylariaceae sp. AK1471]